jgi:hypothetical protein
MRRWGDDLVLMRLDASASNHPALLLASLIYGNTTPVQISTTPSSGNRGSVGQGHAGVSVGDARHLLSGNRLIGMGVEEGERPSSTCAIASVMVCALREAQESSARAEPGKAEHSESAAVSPCGGFPRRRGLRRQGGGPIRRNAFEAVGRVQDDGWLNGTGNTSRIVAGSRG